MKLSEEYSSELFRNYCLELLRVVEAEPGYHTVRRVWLWLTMNPHYATALALRRHGLLKMPWLRLHITDAGRRALGERE